MTIKPYDHSMKPALVTMMTSYFPEVHADIPQEIIETKLIDLIESQAEKKLIQVFIAFEGEIPAGFSIFQIDSQGSDWCKREGWGFIREFYVFPDHRRRGTGRELAGFSKAKLTEMGVHNLYLTCDSSEQAESFWQSCGWVKTASSASNGLTIFEIQEV